MFVDHPSISFLNKIVCALKKPITVKKPVSSDPLAFVFYGWVSAAAVSAFLIGATLFFMYIAVVNTIKNAEEVVALRKNALLDGINFNLFEQMRAGWERKKALPVSPPSRNPFQSTLNPVPKTL